MAVGTHVPKNTIQVPVLPLANQTKRSNSNLSYQQIPLNGQQSYHIYQGDTFHRPSPITGVPSKNIMLSPQSSNSNVNADIMLNSQLDMLSNNKGRTMNNSARGSYNNSPIFFAGSGKMSPVNFN